MALDQIDLPYLPDRNETGPKNMQRVQKTKDMMDGIIIYGPYIEGAVWGGGSKEGYLFDDQVFGVKFFDSKFIFNFNYFFNYFF